MLFSPFHKLKFFKDIMIIVNTFSIIICYRQYFIFMIPFEEAYAIMTEAAISFGTERVELEEAEGCVLAEDCYADADMPPFDKSMMDGFACRKADLNLPLKVVGSVPAGSVPSRPLSKGECMRISTGGMAPPGADHILKKEDAEETSPGWVQCRFILDESNIYPMGRDMKKGGLLLKSGSRLAPPHIAVLASAGIKKPLVAVKPRVAVLSTGNELVTPGEVPGPAAIRDSNGLQLAAQAGRMGLDARYLGIARDEKPLIREMAGNALEQFDVVMISGGVSVGDHDHVPEVLQELGVQILFHRIKAKPGRHLLFGVKEKRFVFGFPGNPVSSFVQFEMIVKPFLLKCMGLQEESASLVMPLASDLINDSPGLRVFLPVRFTSGGMAEPLEYHGSAHIHAYAFTQGILQISPGIEMLKKGTPVHVRPL